MNASSGRGQTAWRMGVVLRSVLAFVAVASLSACSLFEDDEGQRYLFRSSNEYTPTEKFLITVASGCCPLCIQPVVVDGQTPDDVIGRYIEYLESKGMSL